MSDYRRWYVPGGTYNPVKHGYVRSPSEWPYSTFNRFVEAGHYMPDWGCTVPYNIRDMNYE